eukprot:TCONS_00015362-protein
MTPTIHDHPHVVDFVNDGIRRREDSELVDGDERIRKTSRKRRSSGSQIKLWASTTIPYVVGSGATLDGYDMEIENALAKFSEHTCLKFVRRTTEKDYIKFIPNQGCWSYVGYSPDKSGVQEIAIDEWSCLFEDLIQHEAMHALGFWHEHQRPDRDQYVVIHKNNIREGKEHNFDIVYDWIEAAKSEKYDVKSVMQYERSYFTNNFDLFTMEMKGGDKSELGGYELTKSDIKEINRMYCRGESPKKPTTTTKKPTTTTATTTTKKPTTTTKKPTTTTTKKSTKKPTTTTTTTTTKKPTTTTKKPTTTTTKKSTKKPRTKAKTTTTTTTTKKPTTTTTKKSTKKPRTKAKTTTTTTTTKKPTTTTTTKKSTKKPRTKVKTTTTTTTKKPRRKASKRERKKACVNTSVHCNFPPDSIFCGISFYSKGCQKTCELCSSDEKEK